MTLLGKVIIMHSPGVAWSPPLHRQIFPRLKSQLKQMYTFQFSLIFHIFIDSYGTFPFLPCLQQHSLDFHIWAAQSQPALEQAGKLACVLSSAGQEVATVQLRVTGCISSYPMLCHSHTYRVTQICASDTAAAGLLELPTIISTVALDSPYLLVLGDFDVHVIALRKQLFRIS